MAMYLRYTDSEQESEGNVRLGQYTLSNRRDFLVSSLVSRLNEHVFRDLTYSIGRDTKISFNKYREFGHQILTDAV